MEYGQLPRPSLTDFERVTNREFSGNNRFKLGLFSFNRDGGLTNTLAPERWDARWENQVALAQAGEEAGIEFLLPLAGWRGINGKAEGDGDFYESLTWAAGLLAKTQKIHVFSTIHVHFLNPIFAAKQAVTCDHIGSGRLGLNLVAGYNKDEFSMFGVNYQGHEDRYAYLKEWLTIVRQIWTNGGPFNFNGSHFNLSNVWGGPKPLGSDRPILVSAGSSETGRNFALTYSDALFMFIADIDTLEEEVRSIRKSMGNRKIKIYASGHVFCKKTASETKDYYHYLIHEKGDWDAGHYLLKAYEEIKSAPTEVLHAPEFIERLMSGHGTFPIIGDPDEVVTVWKRISDAGIDGMAFALPNYLEDFKIIQEDVLPRLENLGLREKYFS